jgi:hypothetical protein
VAGAAYSGVETAAKILKTTSGELLKDHKDQKMRIYEAEDESDWPLWISQKIEDKKKRFADPILSTHKKINSHHLKTTSVIE